MANAVRLRRQRMRVYFREKGLCFYCNKFLSFPDSTRDHIIPKSMGGMNVYENIVLSCQSCNNERGDSPAEEFLLKKMKKEQGK